MAESAPLLDQSHGGNDSAETAHSSAILRKLKITTLVFSVITFAVLIANHIVLRNAPLGYFGHWDAERATRELAIWIFVSLIFSSISVAVALPILINFIVDVVLASGVLVWAIDLLTSLPTAEWCRRFKYPSYPSPDPPEELPPLPKCEDSKIIIRWLMIAGGAVGILVGVIYIALAVIRVIAILKSKFWRNGPLSFGNGEITFQISLKIRGQDRVTSVEQGVEDAGPSSGRGPLYL